MERLKSYKEMEPTYRELSVVLDKLKFENRSTKELYLYVNDKLDVLVALPLKKSSQTVNKARFAAISLNFENMGVIEHRYDLGKMIEQHRLQEQAASA